MSAYRSEQPSENKVSKSQMGQERTTSNAGFTSDFYKLSTIKAIFFQSTAHIEY